MVAEILEATRCVRPGLRELYDMLLAQKAAGRISGVFMCTAASDAAGWVSFLRSVLEAWYGAPIYDGVVDCMQLDAWNAARGLRRVGYSPVYKDMHLIRKLAGVPPDARVIAVDDRPQYIVNGEAVGVTPYTVAVNLLEVVQRWVPHMYAVAIKKYLGCLQASWAEWLVRPSLFTDVDKDTALVTCTATLLEKLTPSTS
jgi:hypothetical protein